MTEQIRERSSSDSDESLRQRAEIVYRLLGEAYGIAPWKPRRAFFLSLSRDHVALSDTRDSLRALTRVQWLGPSFAC